jgi:rubrerythrin
MDYCRKRFPGHPVLSHFERLAADERRHVGLVGELLDILARQEGEVTPAAPKKGAKKAVDTV